MKIEAEIGDDRRAPSAGFNRIRFQGLSLNPYALDELEAAHAFFEGQDTPGGR